MKPLRSTSWWLNHPVEKYARQNGFIFPKDRGENKKSELPPPSLLYFKTNVSYNPIYTATFVSPIPRIGPSLVKHWLSHSAKNWNRLSWFHGMGFDAIFIGSKGESPIPCFPKIGVPQIIHFNRVLNHYQPSILGYLYFWKHPY